jgi:cytochrome c oxidase subunit II
MGIRRLAPWLVTILLAQGCASNHAAMNPAGPRARQIADLMLVFTWVSAVVYLVVIGFLVWAMLRRRARAPGGTGGDIERADAKAKRVIAVATALTVVILLTLACADFVVQRRLSSHPADALRVLITGHQYWWEVEYQDPDPSQHVRTANELHIPVGKPVEVVLTSNDVIHSMWLPNLSGKKDLIPGHTNTEVLLAQQPGTYTGQCAEFCGLQHAHMRLIVTAEPERPGEAGPAGVREVELHPVPQHRGNGCGCDGRSRPYSRREPRYDCRRYSGEYARQPVELDSCAAAPQARGADARDGPCAG